MTIVYILTLSSIVNVYVRLLIYEQDTLFYPILFTRKCSIVTIILKFVIQGS